MNEHEFAELSAGRALHALSPDDERAFQQALLEHPEWQQVADADAETASLLGDSVTPVAPPLAARSQLLARIRRGDEATPLVSHAAAEPVDAVGDDTVALAAVSDDTVAVDRTAAAGDGGDADIVAAAPVADEPVAADAPPPVPATPAAEAADVTVPDGPPTDVVQTIERRNWTRGMFALVASIALLVGIGWGVGAISDALRTPPAVSLLAQIEAAPDAQEASGQLEGGGQATLHWSTSVGEAVIVASGLPAIEADRTFELWFVRDGTPISAGTFEASDGDATAELAGQMEAGDVVAVTVEPAGGAPGGSPTGDPIVAIIPAEA